MAADGDLDPAELSQLGLCRGAVAFILEGRRKSVAVAQPAPASDEEGANPRVMIVEDDGSYRAALCAALSPDYRCTACRDAESALVELGRDPAVSAFLLDYRLPGMTGIEFLAVVFRRFPLGGVPAIILTSSDDRAIEEAAYEAGSVNFIRKPCDPAAVKLRLDAAVNSAREGEERAKKFLRSRVARAMGEGSSASPLDETAFDRFGLSPREIDVTRLLANGLQAKEIADGLGLSAHTVMNHIRNLYGKCGVSNRVEFIRKITRP